MKVTKATLLSEIDNLRQEMRRLRNEATILEEIPRLEQSMLTTLVVALEKTTESVAHVLSDLRQHSAAKRG
mgnify:CR=1 FL=1